MSKPMNTKIYASDALDGLLDEQRKHNPAIWLLSYLDVFVLVVMLMVTMVALSDFNVRPKNNVVDKSMPGENTVAPVTLDLQKRTPPPEIPDLEAKPPSETPVVEPLQLQQTAINDKINDLGLQETIKMTMIQGAVQFDIQENVLFESSAAELMNSGKAVLARLLPVLQSSPGLVTIEGHTDNRPINTSRFHSNWELSAARAISVLHYLNSQQLESGRLRAVSYADTKPIADNNTDAGREKNRRVNIIIQLEGQPQIP